MRRPTRYGLTACLLLLVLLGAYGIYWTVVAHRIESGIAAWAQAEAARQVDLSWKAIGVSGFPARFRVDLKNAGLRDRSVRPAPELRVPILSGSAYPWDLRTWRLTASSGLSAGLAGAGGRPPLEITARAADGAMAFGADRAVAVWLRLQQANAAAGPAVRAGAADLWITVPPTPPRSHVEPNFGVAVDLRELELPVVVRALGDRIGELAFGITLKGALPRGNLVRSITAWRDAGGTVELDNLDLEWGGFGATAKGTIALDRDLQPIGAFSGAVEGYDRILRALVAAGRMRPDDAGLAQLALTMLAKAGPDGRPQIATSFTVQNGQMFLGPARLGAAPRIAWK